MPFWIVLNLLFTWGAINYDKQEPVTPCTHYTIKTDAMHDTPWEAIDTCK